MNLLWLNMNRATLDNKLLNGANLNDVRLCKGTMGDRNVIGENFPGWHVKKLSCNLLLSNGSCWDAQFKEGKIRLRQLSSAGLKNHSSIKVELNSIIYDYQG